jgi:PAS domain S-box-containing protein
MEDRVIKVLLVEDNPGDARLFWEMLSVTDEEEYSVTIVERLSNAMVHLKNEGVDVILLDLGLPDSIGLDTFRTVHSFKSQLPIIILTGLDDRVIARAAVSEGAQDYLVKDQINNTLLISSIRYSIERKKIEEALRESEAKFRELADAITDVFFALDKDLKCTYWNKASENLLGISSQNAIGKTIGENFSDVPASRNAEEVYREVLTTQKFKNVKMNYLIKGKSYTFDIYVYPSRSGLAVLAKDITEKEKAEEALFLTYYSLDQSPFFVAWIGLDARFRYINETACKNLGYSKEELLSMKVFDTDADFTLAQWLALWEELKNKKTVTIESYLKTKQGYVFPVEILCTYLEFRGQEYHFTFARDITDRRKAEQVLRESEERYRRIVDTANEGIWMLDEQDRTAFVNTRMAEMLGYTAEEIFGKPAELFLCEGELSDHRKKMETRRKGISEHYERKLCRKDGTIRWTIISGTPILDAQGNFRGSFGMFTDITERKKFEKTLKEKETRYRLLIERMSNAVVVYEAVDNGDDFVFKSFNRAGEKIENISRDKVIGKRVTKVFPGVKEFRLLDVFRRVWKTGIPEFLQASKYEDERASGWRENYVYKLPSGEIVAVYDDVTERKQAEDALRESEEKYRTLTENINVGIYRTTPGKDGVFLEANLAMIKMFGYTKDEFLKLKMCDLYNNPEERTIFNDKIIKNGFQRNREFVSKRKDGTTFIGSDSGVAVKDKDGTVIYFDGILEDITERKYMEQMLLQSEKMASIGTLTAGIAHEINNPMGYILCNIKVLEKYSEYYTQFYDGLRELFLHYNQSPGIDKFYEEFQRLATRLNIEYYVKDMSKAVAESIEGAEQIRKIIIDLQDFARPEKYEIKPTDINNALEKTLNVIWNEIKYKAEVIKNFGQLPKVECDSQRISQVFMNILVNAVQAIENTGKIMIDTFIENEYAVIQIRDTGKGIPQKYQSQIFDAFFTTKDPGKGTGLGLTIAYRIIQEHNGQITVESGEAKGTTFTVKLPIKQRKNQ